MATSEQRSATNVLVIGAGSGGLRASIELAERGIDVLCVGKCRRDDAHTTLAAGGINAALGTIDPDDSWAQHAADTLREGYWLSDPAAVEYLARQSPAAIEELVGWGAQFAREDDGRLSQRFFGGRPGVRAYGFDIQTGRRHLILADAVMLAAGGHTRIWRRSSSRRDENTGDAMRLAAQAGARLQDMELVQFHPTGMVHPDGAEGTLVTEAVRGEGGQLRNADGERFMARYDPERGELSTRDRVALANHTEIAEGRGTEHGGVWLDVSHLDRAHILDRLPRMYRQFIDLVMLDITREPMEVAPTAHYSMGGVRVDPETHASDVEGLYAVGECASGVHGANRLGGNSLGECVVFGRIVGEQAARFSADVDVHVRDRTAIDAARAEIDDVLDGDRHGSRGGSSHDEFPRPLQRAVRDLMSTWCGVVRDETGLRRGLAELDDLDARARSMTVQPDIAGHDDLAHAVDLRGSLLAARATLESALVRTETRGAHVRSDHPDLDPAQAHNLLWTAADVTTAPVGTASGEILALIDSDEELTTAGRLLE